MDDVTEPDLMNDFDCIFQVSQVGAAALSTPWSAVQRCRPYYNVDTVQYVYAQSHDGQSIQLCHLFYCVQPYTVFFYRLYFRHREYAVPEDAVLQIIC